MSTDNRNILAMKSPLFGPPQPHLRQNMTKRFSAQALALHDGRHGGKELYIAVAGLVYNVNKKKELFCPGGPLDFCAGCDATRALALMPETITEETLTGDVSDLGEDEKQLAEYWGSFFRHRFDVVGVMDTYREVIADAHETTSGSTT
ncbi:hypothetical protein BC835DRAFT_1419922 [Cytidiella melzeri]|nr:hypothetical protein BC835DRAFT_1424718 [Cytidiella melzeri]KAI0687207.1 hypothetical protein BC835DRAFT_1419922 [Cytidiella melzeri]